MQIQVEDLIKLIAYFSKEEELMERNLSILTNLEDISYRLNDINDKLRIITNKTETFDEFINGKEDDKPFIY